MSIPFSGKDFTLTQPDGTQLKVRGWGDQYHAVFETLDGYTVVQDPVSGFYQYAQLSSDHEDLKPTGVRPGAADPTLLGLAPGARVTRAAALAKAREHPGCRRGIALGTTPQADQGEAAHGRDERRRASRRRRNAPPSARTSGFAC